MFAISTMNFVAAFPCNDFTLQDFMLAELKLKLEPGNLAIKL